MKKQLFYAPLWGIFALSILSSCRTEDNFTQQNNQQDKRFAVFVPGKPGEKINYANGFAYLMKRYDNLHKTNLSGINNQPVIGNFSAGTEKKALAFQNAASYVEFNVRSQTITEENGDKWLIYAKVQGNKVVGLIAAILSNKETYVAYKEIDQQHVLYTQNIFRFQLALDKYQKHKILSSAKAVTPPPGGSDGDSGCGADVEQCGNIEEVIITKPKQTGVFYIDVWLGRTPGEGGGGCGFYDNCSPGDGSGGGGGDETPPIESNMVMPPPPKNPINNLKKYLECIDSRSSANIKVYANTTGVIGHAFISIQQGFNIRTFGFYPEGSFPQNIDGLGIMGDDSGDHYDAALDMGTVSSEQLQHILRKAMEYNDRVYNLYYSNCANFAMDVMQIIKPSIQESKWEKPGTIEDQIVNNGGVKQSGKGPVTHVNCN